MLRVLVGLLVAANLLFFGWSRGWWGHPEGEREPGRLTQQERPEAVRLLPASAAAERPGVGATGNRRVAPAAAAPASAP